MSYNNSYSPPYVRVLMTILLFINTCTYCLAQLQPLDTINRNLHLKFNLDINKRNIILAAVPNLYIITIGPRHHVGETYGKFYRYPDGHFDFIEQLRIGTISHRQTVFSNLLPYITPNPYNQELFDKDILSPFNSKNTKFYRYTQQQTGDSIYVTFKPRVMNSVLTSGTALINNLSGKIERADFNGEYEQIKYHVDVEMDTVANIPKRCELQAKFRFFGNNITTRLNANYEQQQRLDDSLFTYSNSPYLMSLVRPDSLSDAERAAYAEVYKPAVVDTTTTAQPRKKNFFDKAWSAMYDYLIASIRVGDDQTGFSLSPILDPLGFGYSSSKGISYRMRLYCAWKTSPNSNIRLQSYASYYTRRKQFYFDVPLRYTFNERKNGFAEVYFANGNRISDSHVLDMLKENNRLDTIDFNSLGLEHFSDRELSCNLNIPIGRHFFLSLGNVYHVRTALNKQKLEELGQQTVYRSCAPSVTFKYRPSSYVDYTINYERGVKGVFGSDLRYERIEADAQFAKKFNALSSLNIRFGLGGFTQMETTYFVDYKNFYENNLPEAWDEWKGHFFLLDSELYNASNYYIRTNVSYESPLLPLAYIPWVGYYIQKECIYVSALQLQRTRPYFELGYSFTTRFAAFGVFASSFGTHFQGVGTKITFELFRHW